MAGLVFGELGRAPEVGDEVRADGLCPPRGRARRLADHEARGRVRRRRRDADRRASGRIGSLDEHCRRFCVPAPRLRALLGVAGHGGAGAADGGRRDRLAGLLDLGQRARSRAHRPRGVPSVAAAGAPGRAPGGPPAPQEPPHRHGVVERRRAGGPSRRDHRGQRPRVAVLRARVRPGNRKRDRRACRACADAVARPAGDPRQRARPALDRVPGLGGRRSGDRRHPLRDPARARLRRRDRPRVRRARVHPRDAQRPRTCSRGRRRSRRGARRGSPDPPHERASWRDLARPVRGAPRRRRRAPADLREGHPRRSARPGSGSCARRLLSARSCARS